MKRLPDTIAAIVLLAGLLIAVARLTVGCLPPDTDVRAATYAVTLEECNRSATTLCDSVRCENKARASMGRFPRALPASCKVQDAVQRDLTLDGGYSHD